VVAAKHQKIQQVHWEHPVYVVLERGFQQLEAVKPVAHFPQCDVGFSQLV
jgi:hypothetical protein